MLHTPLIGQGASRIDAAEGQQYFFKKKRDYSVSHATSRLIAGHLSLELLRKEKDIKPPAGGSGYIRFCTTSDGQLYVAKVIKAKNGRNFTSVEIDKIQRENDNFWLAHAECAQGNFFKPIFKTNKAYIIMPDFGDEDLLTVISNAPNPSVVLTYLYMAIEEIDRLHRLGMIHYDIKPENLMLFGEVHAVDFGMSRNLNSTQQFCFQKGTLKYVAPEIQQNIDSVQAADIYSFGMMQAYALGMLSMEHNLAARFIDPNFIKKHLKNNPAFSSKTNQRLHTLIIHCTDSNYSKRPSSESVQKELFKILFEIQAYSLANQFGKLYEQDTNLLARLAEEFIENTLQNIAHCNITAFNQDLIESFFVNLCGINPDMTLIAGVAKSKENLVSETLLDIENIAYDKINAELKKLQSTYSFFKHLSTEITTILINLLINNFYHDAEIILSNINILILLGLSDDEITQLIKDRNIDIIQKLTISIFMMMNSNLFTFANTLQLAAALQNNSHLNIENFFKNLRTKRDEDELTKQVTEACESQHIEILKHNPNHSTKQGCLPLEVALQQKNAELITAILQSGGKLNQFDMQAFRTKRIAPTLISAELCDLLIFFYHHKLLDNPCLFWFLNIEKKYPLIIKTLRNLLLCNRLTNVAPNLLDDIVAFIHKNFSKAADLLVTIKELYLSLRNKLKNPEEFNDNSYLECILFCVSRPNISSEKALLALQQVFLQSAPIDLTFLSLIKNVTEKSDENNFEQNLQDLFAERRVSITMMNYTRDQLPSIFNCAKPLPVVAPNAIEIKENFRLTGNVIC